MTPGRETAFVALGANLDDPARQVRRAIEALRAIPDTRLIRASSLYRTAPIGVRGQPDFVNAVAMLETALAPQPLLDALLAIETRFGRRRHTPLAARTLDLDLLLHGDTKFAAHDLILPHPRMHLRAFVLVPLLEIAPLTRIPGRGKAQAWLPAVAHQRLERLP